MKVRDLLSFSAFAVMIAFGIASMGALGVRVGLPADRTNISMLVPDVNNLVVGSNVLLRGVPVGEVTSITNSLEGGTVDFYFKSDFEIPVDSEVRLENLSALGESYIGLVPRTGGGPMLRDGERIAAAAVKQPPSISEMTTSVVRVLNQLDPAALARVIGEADIALPDPNSTLPNLEHTSRLLRNTAAGMQGRGRELLDNLQILLGNAGWLGPLLAELTPMINDFNPHFRMTMSATPVTVESGIGGPESVYTFSRYLARIQQLLDNNGGDLKVIGENFGPKLQGIAGALMNFDSGQILTNLLDGMPEDGAITLRVALPDK